MKLYNSATRKKEDFVPNHPDIVKMYTCGPTVYHFAHIGNLRSYIMEDVLEKYLRYAGYPVKRVMNITDVGHLTSDADEGEDKMLKGARREHKTVMEIAKFYTDAFFEDCRKLNIKKPDVVQPATGCIDEYIKIITKLLDTGYAYIEGGNVYFDTSKLEKYYIFNEHKEEDLAVGVREGVEEDTNKRNKNDFVLWFTKSKFEDQALKWDSPWGVGYPGWHIECTGISLKYLGEHLDIHCGGIDNAFPHHTNEIAQSESYIGHHWCNYWMHVMHLNTASGKMSKSKGEFLTVSLLEQKGYDPLCYRLFCLQSHYRRNLVFSWENLDNAAGTYQKLLTKIAALKPGDGEIDEGQVWEMALFANSKHLDNLIAFVDFNKLQIDGRTDNDDVCNLGDIAEKFRAFGWFAQRVDGHDVAAINNAIEWAKLNKNSPSVIVLDTIKGKGWPAKEAVPSNHAMRGPAFAGADEALAAMRAELAALQ